MTTRRYLVGPVSAEQARHWQEPRRAGACLAFNARGDLDLAVGPADTWDDLCRRLPQGWRPDFVVLDLAYHTVPPGLYQAPVPLVGLAAGWHLLWHHYRYVLPRCELVLADTAGAEVMRRAGWDHARPALLHGLEPDFEATPPHERERDIDVLFVGNLHPAVQRQRLPSLARLARLAPRRRVVIRTAVSADDYRSLLARARIVFNHSSRGACNRRVLEAAAAGALLFQEAGNRELPPLFQDRREYVAYTDEDLEALLEHYLTHEDERRALADAAARRLPEFTPEALWGKALEQVEQDWPRLLERLPRRPAWDPEQALLARTWQALGAGAGGDPALAGDLAAALAGRPPSAALHNALGLAVTLAGQGEGPTTAPRVVR
jgi:hypothetical protein